MIAAAQEFHDVVNDCLRNEHGAVPRKTILNACDALRYVYCRISSGSIVVPFSDNGQTPPIGILYERTVPL